MTDTIEAVARILAPMLEGGREYDQMPATRRELKIWNRAGMCSINDATQEDAREAAEQAITAHTKALIEGAGELEKRLLERTIISRHEDGSTIGYEPSAVQQESAATIAALKAEIERLTEREAQAKLDGVRAGIEAAFLEVDGMGTRRFTRDMIAILALAGKSIRALDAAAIVKGEG